MKKRIICILITIVFMLTITSISVSAESDPEGDVVHWKGFDWRNWNWNVQDRQNIDIIDVSYTAGDRLTFSLTVKGSFNEDKSYYHVWYNTSDAWYHMQYVPGEEEEPFVGALPLNLQTWDIEDIMNYTEPVWEASVVNDNTITGTIDWITEDHEVNSFHGWAQEWDKEEDITVETWLDFAPDAYAWYGVYDDYYGGDNNGGGDNGGSDTGGSSTDDSPGFEVIALLVGIGLLFFVFRKKK